MTKRPWSHHWLIFKIIVSMHSGRCKRPKHHKVSSLRARQTFCHRIKLGCAMSQVLCVQSGSVSQKGLSGVGGDTGEEQWKGSWGWSNSLPKGDYKGLGPFTLNRKNKHDRIRRVLGKLNAELLLTESLNLMKQEADWFKSKRSFTERIGNSCTLFWQRGWRQAVPAGWEREKTNSWSAGLWTDTRRTRQENTL